MAREPSALPVTPSCRVATRVFCGGEGSTASRDAVPSRHMRVTVLASGSGGNAAVFEAGGTSILIDAGVPLPTLLKRMRGAGVAPRADAIIVTHAHGDHHRFAPEASLHFRAPVWVSEAARPMLPLHGAVATRVFGLREPFRVGAMLLRPLALPHDAPQVSLRVEHGGAATVLATDLGEVPAAFSQHTKGAQALLLESNHDPDMLRKGPYSASLKRRVASSRGHLSNAQACEVLRRLDPSFLCVVLMHLSETNNHRKIALDEAADALADHPARLLVAAQDSSVFVDVVPQGQLELFSRM